MYTVLSIAGSDPSGGAGIQADLKAFQDQGAYGMAVITALTAQNTAGVVGVQAVPPDFVRQQIAAVLDDLPVGAVKLGMLANVGIIEAVAAALADYSGPVVLDPVMVSTSGHRLLEPSAETALRALLAPRALVVTPNLPEAEILLGGLSAAAWAAQTGTAVLLKDGHGTGAQVEDVLYLPDGQQVARRHPRIVTRNTHGTGCTLSAALAARLAGGEPLADAVCGAVDYVAMLVARSVGHTLGAGKGPLLHGIR